MAASRPAIPLLRSNSSPPVSRTAPFSRLPVARRAACGKQGRRPNPGHWPARLPVGITHGVFFVPRNPFRSREFLSEPAIEWTRHDTSKGGAAMRYGRIGLVWMTVFLLGTPVADAAPRERRLLRLFFSSTPTRAEVSEPPMQAPERPYWSDTPEFYPQWYGGFHGRMLQNLGYPPGDLGPRGTAW